MATPQWKTYLEDHRSEFLEDVQFHAPNEFFRISSFERGQKGYCLLLHQLAKSMIFKDGILII